MDMILDNIVLNRIIAYILDFIKLFVIEVGIFGYKPKKDWKAPAAALAFTAAFIVAAQLTKHNVGLSALIQLLYLMSNAITISQAVLYFVSLNVFSLSQSTSSLKISSWVE